MVDSLKSNSFILPALLLAALLYLGLLPVQKTKPYSSLVAWQNAAAFEGRVVKSPSMLGGRKKTCKIELSLSRVWDKNGIAAAAQGQADIFLPAELCEIYKPGKLYTAWRGSASDFLLDQGALVQVDAKPARFKIAAPSAPGQKSVSGKKSVSDQKGAALERPIFESQKIISCSYDGGLWGSFQKIRALSRLHFSRLMFAWGEAGGLLLALLSGDRSYLNDGAGDAFRLAGLSHILALSGMHLSLIGGLAFAFGKKAAGKKAALALEFLCMLAFVWFAGKSPSLFRALLCSLCALASALFKLRTRSGLNSLALVFIIHAALFPADAFELSFMLSYGALFGILAFNEFVSKRLFKALPSGAGSSFASSIGAQLATAPVTLKFFGLVAPGGVAASAALSPLVTLFVYAGLFCVFLSLAFPLAAPFCGGLLGFFYGLIIRAVFFFAKIPCVKI